MMINIHTDASFRQRENIGSYGFIITCKQGRIEKSGLFKDPVYTSNEAELKAIINGLHLALSTYTDVNHIAINTDSRTAIGVLCIKKKVPEGYGKYRNLFLKTLKNHGLTINKVRFNHVKAHQKNMNPLQYKNHLCDLLTKKAYEK